METELPGRTVTNFMVPMHDEQRVRYDDYHGRVARLIKVAQRPPLTKQEFDRLQQWLACMRMVCDTPYILDPNCRVSPKLEELEPVLAELVSRHGDALLLLTSRKGNDGRGVFVAVLDADAATVVRERELPRAGRMPGACACAVQPVGSRYQRSSRIDRPPAPS